jgi:SAM-dependent methyltransferase
LSQQTVLHVGCGGNPAPDWLDEFKEVRLDIDARHNPDIVASMLDLGAIGPFDVVYSSHALEHVYPHEVHVALTEFNRVLADSGRLVVVVPDLEDIKPTEDVVYECEAGPITGLDMYYGWSKVIQENPFMAHKCGFVKDTLTKVLLQAGFRQAVVARAPGHNLVGVAIK